MAIPMLESVAADETIAAAAVAPKNMGKDQFLKLLVTQLEYQNPLEPLEGTEFTAQLAQFTSLEQLQDVNDNLESLKTYQTSLNNIQAVGLIGKQAHADSMYLRVKDGQVSQGGYTLDQQANVLINLFNSTGGLVRTIDQGTKQAGTHEFNWDGKDQYGDNCPDGTYSFDVLASDIEGNPLPSETHIVGEITALNLTQGTPYLLIDGIEVSVEDILEVMEAEA
jgi:flagellar basal-body rod modification protein FlgD